MKYGEMYPLSKRMPSTSSSSMPKVCDSSTVMTPSLPTLSMASAMTSPISRSLLADTDREIGEVIAEAMDKVGKDGVITVEESQTFGIELELVEGMRFDKG